MYEDLIRRLRELASIPEHCEDIDSCDKCSKENICLSFTNKRIIEVVTQAANAIEELQKAVMRLEDESGLYDELPAYYIYPAKWIPVTERLPDEKDSGFSADVLILVKERDGDFTWKDVYSGYYLYDAVSDETGWWAQMPQNCQQIKERFSVTHWMPLPELPKEAE